MGSEPSRPEREGRTEPAAGEEAFARGSAVSDEPEVVLDRTLLLFPDTNLLLHYKRPDQIDWPALVGHRQVRLILTTTVVRELDKHKRHPRLRKRAEDVIRWASSILEGSGAVRSGVTLEAVAVEPSEFARYQLDREEPDDRHLASILGVQGQNPELVVAVGTSDMGMRLKAKGLGIRIVELDETHKLPPEIDPENAELRRENAELRRVVLRRPELAATFAGGAQFIRVPRPRIPPARDIHLKLDEERCLLEQRAPPEGRLDRALTVPGMPSRREAFVGNLRAHLEKLRTHLEAVIAREAAESRYIALEFEVRNTGTCPANDVVVVVRPDGEAGVTLVRERELPPVSDRPEFGTISHAWLRSLAVSADVAAFPVEQSVGLEEFNVNTSSWQVRTIVHQIEARRLPRVYAEFASRQGAKSFRLNVRTVCAELADPVESFLNVVLE